MKKDSKVALLVWLVLFAQGAVCILLTEPYPAFAFPSFGLKGQNAASVSQPVREEVVIKAMNGTDTVNLTSSSYMRHLSEPTYRAMCRKLERRHNLNLARSDARSTTRILYRQLLKPEQNDVYELKTWIEHQYRFSPKYLALERSIDSTNGDGKNKTGIRSAKLTTIEVFK